MNLKKIIQFNLTQFTSVGLVMIFLIPIGLKLIHSIEYHSNQNLCKNNKTHIHESNSHNDVLDYFFQPLVHSSIESFKIKIISIDKKIENYYSYLFYSKPFTGTELRGPPFILFA